MVALRDSLSLFRNVRRSSRTRTSRSTVTLVKLNIAKTERGFYFTSSSRRTSQGIISPITSCTRLLSPSEIWCICQSRSTSRIFNRRSRRSLCLYPPTESKKFETTISPRTTGFIAHSVPRKVTPVGESRNTSRPEIRTALATEVRRFPARICRRVDFPAGINVCQDIIIYTECATHLHLHR